MSGGGCPRTLRCAAIVSRVIIQQRRANYMDEMCTFGALLSFSYCRYAIFLHAQRIIMASRPVCEQLETGSATRYFCLQQQGLSHQWLPPSVVVAALVESGGPDKLHIEEVQ